MSEVDKGKVVRVKGSFKGFAILKLHASLHFLRLNSEQLKGFDAVVAKEVIKGAFNLLQLLIGLFGEGVREVHAYHTSSILYDVVKYPKYEVGYAIKHSKGEA
jgi:hypothetical protein